MNRTNKIVTDQKNEGRNTMPRIASFTEYFQAIDREVLEKIAFDYPKLTVYYYQLKESFEAVENLDPFQVARRLLALDAQIQILIEYLRWDLLEIYSEDEVIQRLKEDSGCYYREKTGLRSSDAIPLGIMYLGDQVGVLKEA